MRKNLMANNFFSVVAVSETASKECAPAAGVCSPGLQPPLLTLSVWCCLLNTSSLALLTLSAQVPPPPKPRADDLRRFQARQQECVLSSLRFHLLRGCRGASLTGGSCCFDSFMGAVPTSQSGRNHPFVAGKVRASASHLSRHLLYS